MRTSHPVLLAATIGGAVGTLVALFLEFVVPHGSISLHVLLTLWPAAIFLFVDLGSGSPSFELFKIIAALCGNAMIYALVATLFASAFVVVRGFLDQMSEQPPSIKSNRTDA